MQDLSSQLDQLGDQMRMLAETARNIEARLEDDAAEKVLAIANQIDSLAAELDLLAGH